MIARQIAKEETRCFLVMADSFRLAARDLLDALLSQTGCVIGRKEMFYLTTHSTHFIYGYMASDIW